MKVTNCTCPKCLEQYPENVARQSKYYPYDKWFMDCSLCGQFTISSSVWDEIYKDVPDIDWSPPASFLHEVIHRYKTRP